MEMGRILVMLGVALVVIGGLVMLLGRTGLPLGRLPGDILCLLYTSDAADE